MLQLGWLLHIKNIDIKAFLKRHLFYFLHEPKPSPFSTESELLASDTTSQVTQEIGSHFLGKWREAFLGLCLTHSWGGQSVWSQPLSLPFSLLILFWELFFPFLLPPWCEFVCGWFSWAQRPAEYQFCLLFVLTLFWDQPLIPSAQSSLEQGTPFAFF